MDTLTTVGIEFLKKLDVHHDVNTSYNMYNRLQKSIKHPLKCEHHISIHLDHQLGDTI